MARNGMKQKLARGEPVLGCSVMFPSPQLVEMLGHAGFDWVLLDCEHGSLSMADVEVMAMAADAAGMTPIGRPQGNAATDIMRLMDRGVAGVQVPHINTAADARRAVSAVKFGPMAARGLAAGTRPDKWGFSGGAAAFIEAANHDSIVIVQIEHEEAVTNIDEILQVEGIDVFFIGPSDLSQSLGYPGDQKAPAVVRAIATALDAIKRAGKLPGIPATAETIADTIGKGHRYIYTHVPKLIAAGANEFLKPARQGKSR